MRSWRTHSFSPVFKAQPNPQEWSVRAVLTVPIPDRAGDIVEPSGLDFTLHQKDPWVDLEHGRTMVRRQPVGWARKSLARPGAPYALDWAILEVPGLGLQKLPIGTTYFDRDDPLQRQVFELIRQDALPGVSLEFQPEEAEELGPSPLENRPACRFRKAKVLRWSHCAEPVNPAALTVTKSLAAGISVIQKALRDGRLGGEPLHPYLASVLAEYRSPPCVLGVKAMPVHGRKTEYDDAERDERIEDAEDLMEAGQGESAAEPGALSEEAPPNNGVAALLAHAQALLDLCEQLEQDLESTDSPDLLRKGQDLIDQVRELAQKAKKIADEHDARLQAVKEGRSADEEDTVLPDMAVDADGQLKAVRPVYRAVLKACRIRRYRLPEILRGIRWAQNPLDEELLRNLRVQKPAEYRREILPRLRTLQRLRRLGG